ncbi:hypothetical protein NKI98_29400 [Mesorhizobium sp. M0222]|uniref:hypothetical protein n=1 Tax=Mesorhizobium sp. M0222 TaxID=2956921 RepID=UPI003338906C
MSIVPARVHAFHGNVDRIKGFALELWLVVITDLHKTPAFSSAATLAFDFRGYGPATPETPATDRDQCPTGSGKLAADIVHKRLIGVRAALNHHPRKFRPGDQK